jgi:hypothetical protein
MVHGSKLGGSAPLAQARHNQSLSPFFTMYREELFLQLFEDG